MLAKNSVLFISDLHLSERAPSLTKLFQAFIDGPASQADALYILGDLFDVWVGDDLNPLFHEEINQILMPLKEKRIPVYFMPGNRDFLISSPSLKKFNMIGLADRVVIDLHGIPTLLMHGDLLCTSDIAYQRYRKIAQHPLTKAFFLKLPKRLRQSIANSLRQNSQRYQKNQSLEILDVTQDAVIDEMHKARVLNLIHGHVHRAAFHDLKIHHEPAQRAVLGDWHEDSGSVIISSPGKMTLASFTQDQALETKSCLTVP